MTGHSISAAYVAVGWLVNDKLYGVLVSKEGTEIMESDIHVIF